MIESLQHIWQSILNITSVFVIPDWAALIGLLPVFLFLGVVMPILSLLLLGWLIYVVRAPRTKVTFEEGPRAAPIGADGRAMFPTGEPFCSVDDLVYPFGATRCEVCRRDLTVVCPKCSVGRGAEIETCGNCGLILRIENRPRRLRAAGPPPGGAAAA